MDKRNRLGWVPMLLKAYNDAKQALEAKMQELEQNQPSFGGTPNPLMSAPLTKQPLAVRSYPKDLPQNMAEPEPRRTRSHWQTTPRSVSAPEPRSTHSNLQALSRGVTEPMTQSMRSNAKTPNRNLPVPETRKARSYVQAPMQKRVMTKATKNQVNTNIRSDTRIDAKPRYTQNLKRPKRQENDLNYPRVVPSSYQSVVRELRETRRRLNRIETVQSNQFASIQEELKRMQQKLDRRIQEITSVLGKHKSHRT